MSNFRDMIALNSMLFESMYEHEEKDVKQEESEFVDIMRIGELDFLPDQVVRDPWAQKMEDKLKVDEDENEKELDKEKTDELEAKGDEKPEEKPKEEEKEKPKEEEKEEETETPPKEREEGDEENERERQTETPPKDWEDEEDDDEPNENKFDKNLFQVKMLYKRPKDDRLRQEEIGRIKDAIDRCLALYRTQKQNESDEALQEKKRRNLAERAEALRRQRSEEMLSRGIGDILGDTFTSQAAKIVLPKPEDEAKSNEVDELEQRVEEVKKHDIKIGSLNLNEQKPDASFDYSELNKLKEEKPQAPVTPKETKQETKEKRVIINSNDPWALSSTTLNQKYSRASGHTGKIEAIDENLVNVGRNPLKLRSAGDILGGTFGQDRAVIKINRKPAKNVEENISQNIKVEDTAKTSQNVKADTAVKSEKSLIDKKEKSAPINKTENATLSAEKAETKSSENKPKVVKKAIGEKPNTLDVVTTAKPINDEDSVAKKSVKGLNIRISDNRDPWALSNTTLNQKYSRPSGIKTDFEAVDEKKVGVGKISVRRKSVNEILSGDFMGDRVEIKIKPTKQKSEASKEKTGTKSKITEKSNKANAAKDEKDK